jgi:hypothetical protein
MTVEALLIGLGELAVGLHLRRRLDLPEVDFDFDILAVRSSTSEGHQPEAVAAPTDLHRSHSGPPAALSAYRVSSLPIALPSLPTSVRPLQS